MRDPKRIYEFCNELATIWTTKVPDWRFGQLMLNVMGEMQASGRDPFFPDEDEMLEFFWKYFKKDRGKWMVRCSGWMCSECGHVVPPDRISNYCPDCGAKMQE